MEIRGSSMMSHLSRSGDSLPSLEAGERVRQTAGKVRGWWKEGSVAAAEKASDIFHEKASYGGFYWWRVKRMLMKDGKYLMKSCMSM